MTRGDPCPNCAGFLQTLNTYVVFENRVRYIGCRKCGYRPDDNVEVVPLKAAPRQPPKFWQLRKIATVATSTITKRSNAR